MSSAATRPARDRAPLILIAGGGSGGHISPGLAIAERLADGSRATALFVCSEREIDAHMLGNAGASFLTIPARPPSVRPLAAARFLRAFRLSSAACRQVIQERGVDQVLALGGFVAAPAAAAARRLGVPLTLLNLDDPPGRANRWIAGRADRVWTAIRLPRHPAFAERVVGLPIRRIALAPLPDDPDAAAACRARLGLDPARPTLLVTGASQGASSINGMMIELARTAARGFDGWQILHLAGRGDHRDLRDAYEHSAVAATVRPFLDEIGLAWGAADLAVSRAGANSVAEAAANAVPTVFLPYPYHRDRHQRNNAQPVVDLGGAVIADDRIEAAANAASVGPILLSLMSNEAERVAMGARLRAHRPRDAATHVADLLLG